MEDILTKLIEQLEGFQTRVEAEYGGYKIIAYRMGKTVRVGRKKEVKR